MEEITELENQVKKCISKLETVIENDVEKELYYERVDLCVLENMLERLQPILGKKDYSDCDWASEFLDEGMVLSY